MKLSALFSDGMVLQRGMKNRIWGKSIPGILVKGVFGKIAFETMALSDGSFEAELPELPAGGPYELILEADETRRIQDILVGDVFLLGGQSNMELPLERTMERYGKELAGTKEEAIRIFEVPKEYEFQMERDEVLSGRWKKAEGDALLSFSALGFFTAKELKDRYGVPIGLIQTAVGGTPAKAWCSEQTIYQMGRYKEELEQCKVPGYPQKIEQMEAEREGIWLTKGAKSFSGVPVKKGTIAIPGLWKNKELDGFHGAIRLTKQFTLSKEEAAKDMELVLGAIVDADTVYVNGVFTGETGYCYPPRFYQVPKGVLKEGINTVEIQMFVFRDSGGFMPGKQYGLREKGKKELVLVLAGEWNYEIMREMEVLPGTTFFTYKAAALYNGMLSPVRNWNVRAFLYYQGESDSGHPESYVEEMKALIADWRSLWKQNDMPFLYVQLAGFSDGEKEKQGTEWAKFRAAQEQVLSVPETAMVEAYDIGEYNDLHPMNKKTLGQRMSLAVRKLVYHENVICSGPSVDRIRVDETGTVHIHFHLEGTGLMAGYNGSDTQVQEVQLEDNNGTYQDAQAVIQENELVVSSDSIKEPKGIRYAWRDCPMEANLYNLEGLPALPFLRRLE